MLCVVVMRKARWLPYRYWRTASALLSTVYFHPQVCLSPVLLNFKTTVTVTKTSTLAMHRGRLCASV